MQSLSPDRLAAAILLAAIAGAVDAVGFTELGGYFVSFMSGNSTRLGLHLAAHQWSSALFAGGLVALFVGGVAAGALVAERAGRRAAAVILLCEAILLTGASFLLEGPRPVMGAILLPPAMGLANVFLLGEGGVQLGLTYMTGTLVRVGIGLASLGTAGRERGRGRAVALDLMLWLALVAGVVLGGIGRARFGGQVLLAPAVALLVMAMAETLIPRRRVA